jgi:hypothetical protein
MTVRFPGNGFRLFRGVDHKSLWTNGTSARLGPADARIVLEELSGATDPQ